MAEEGDVVEEGDCGCGCGPKETCKTCTAKHPCDTNFDPVIPAHMNISGTAGWVFDFSKCGAKEGDQIQLTDCLLAPRTFIDWVVLTVENPGDNVDVCLGTEADPSRFGTINLEDCGQALADVRQLQGGKCMEPLLLTVKGDVCSGKVIIGMRMHDTVPFDGARDFGR